MGTTPILSREARLVLLTAGGSACDSRIGELLDGPLDWSRVQGVADSERASLIFWRRISTVGSDRVPDDVATAFDRLAMVWEFRLRMLEQRLEETLALLDREHIDVVLLKGAALAKSVYGSFTSRPMRDLDLLVEARQAERARTILMDAGWTWAHDHRYDEFYQSHHHLPPMLDGRGTGVRLELHTAMFTQGHPFSPQPSEVRDAARRAGESHIYVPRPHRLLLHNCLHFAWSHMMQLGAWNTFRDCDALMGDPDFSWDEFDRLVRQYPGSAVCCYWTLRLARDLAGVNVSDAQLASLDPPYPELLLRPLSRHFAMNVLADEAYSPSLRLLEILWEFGMRPNRSGFGPERPWHRTILFPDYSEAGPTAPRGLGRNLRSVGAVLRYFGAIARREVDELAA